MNHPIASIFPKAIERTAVDLLRTTVSAEEFSISLRNWTFDFFSPSLFIFLSPSMWHGRCHRTHTRLLSLIFFFLLFVCACLFYFSLFVSMCGRKTKRKITMSHKRMYLSTFNILSLWTIEKHRMNVSISSSAGRFLMGKDAVRPRLSILMH